MGFSQDIKKGTGMGLLEVTDTFVERSGLLSCPGFALGGAEQQVPV